jgi:hypothetical protein
MAVAKPRSARGRGLLERAITIEVSPPDPHRHPLDNPAGKHLAQLQATIVEADHKSLEARWAYGEILLRSRNGKLLPKGMLDALVARDGISRQEVGFRMQFAELYAYDALSNILESASWYDVTQGLSATRTKVKKTGQPITGTEKKTAQERAAEQEVGRGARSKSDGTRSALAIEVRRIRTRIAADRKVLTPAVRRELEQLVALIQEVLNQSSAKTEVSR